MSVTDLDLFLKYKICTYHLKMYWSVNDKCMYSYIKISSVLVLYDKKNIFIWSKECWPISPKKDLTLLKGLTRICISSSGSSSSLIWCIPRGLYPISGSATCCCCPPCSTTTWAATSGVSLGLSWIKTREREGGRTTRQLTSYEYYLDSCTALCVIFLQQKQKYLSSLEPILQHFEHLQAVVLPKKTTHCGIALVKNAFLYHWTV